MFAFERPINESFKYANTQSKGTLVERMEMAEQKDKQEQVQSQSAQKQNPNVSPQLLAESSDTLMDLLLARPEFNPIAPAQRNRKRKKRKAQHQELKF